MRTWGNSATSSPWDTQEYWIRPPRERGSDNLQLEVDWENLQRPGPRPVYVHEEEAREQLAYHPSDYKPTVVAEALYRNYMPLLAYIGGKPAAFTSKDHNFLPGEAVEKQLILINNSRPGGVTADCTWSFRHAPAVSGTAKVSVPPGDQKRLPLKFDLPTDLAPKQYHVNANVNFGDGENQKDAFAVDVVPRPSAVQASGKIALFDPKGETGKLLDGMGIRWERVDATADVLGK